ncbi:class I SAM-dependent methyltransferase [Streptomyces calidiresistens]|uniref:Methyltransferase domain-containing protein n=1 Tax=Streptomyces calidiresistens TaxID=1485586 RepID=A0A7W3T5N5_9ACTN|nr:methyltransferase domain-containing protein [Streptomyces calidiresistens]MBB0231394.1 methyltransferase domain-containing protein [Streptomyces calidiresistens]
MFSPEGPTFRELAVQALSSTERGYDLLAPKFDHTPFRTPDRVVDAVGDVLWRLGPFGTGLDVCCGTGAGTTMLRGVCRDRVVGVDFSAGMLEVAREIVPKPPGAVPIDWVRADARRLPFTPKGAFDIAISLGAFGHFLPAERPGLFAGVRDALRPGGRFVFPVAAPLPPTSREFWLLRGFDAAMRVRNALWRPPFVMYYGTFRLPDVLADLRGVGFDVEAPALEALGRRPDGSPRCRLVLATRR